MLNSLQLNEQPFKEENVIVNMAFNSCRRVIDDFKPKIIMNIERGDYVIKTVDNADELEETLRLRHDVFYRELAGRALPFNLDMDDYDELCDHLVIKDGRNGQIVGTYRLICDCFSDNFYSEGEFDIRNIKILAGVKLELGRACIAKEYRNGKTILLLWQGLHEYIRKINARYLFGCASVSTTDLMKMAVLDSYLQKRYYTSPDIRVVPNKKYRIKELASLVNVLDTYTDLKPKTARLIPSLLNSYLSLGAKICGEPAFDAEFKCMDYLTILDLGMVNQNYLEKVLISN
jgi:putative hemolysin